MAYVIVIYSLYFKHASLIKLQISVFRHSPLFFGNSINIFEWIQAIYLNIWCVLKKSIKGKVNK